jgi:hypothetical protein
MPTAFLSFFQAGLTLTQRSRRSFSISDWRWMSESIEKSDMRSNDKTEETDDCSQASSGLLPIS